MRSLSIGLAACLIAPAAAEAATTANCLNCLGTVRQYAMGPGRGDFVELANTQGQAAASSSATTALGTTSGAAESGALHLLLDFDANYTVQPGYTATLESRASFVDRVTFDFGDTAYHRVSLPVFLDGTIDQGVIHTNPLFFAVASLSGYTQSVQPQEYNYMIKDNVQQGQPSTVQYAGAYTTSALGYFSYSTAHADVAAGFIFSPLVKSGQSYDLTYSLTAVQGWNGAPLTIDLSHTLIAGTFSGEGLQSVTSENEGVLARQADGSFGYAAALADDVPEPATWAMMVGGFAMVGGALRRRQAVPRTA